MAAEDLPEPDHLGRGRHERQPDRLLPGRLDRLRQRNLDPATTASSVTEAITDDLQVKAACTSTYAKLYGLDLSTSYSINTLGPNDEGWEAGNRSLALCPGPAVSLQSLR